MICFRLAPTHLVTLSGEVCDDMLEFGKHITHQFFHQTIRILHPKMDLLALGTMYLRKRLLKDWLKWSQNV